ncbi:MOSC domain-containing protein [Piscinibacter aquaticus]|uniref:MOSC domain-containing protein n=1 Tax=Piscinibacter aquaticus TaxID=392597 RepID=A0A5C6TXZ0_9BURK|nr:MOSC domain-containing protein [Piscinibacter aquaticus]
MSATGDLDVRIAALHLHPVKSCGAIAVDEAVVIETGLEFDRAWAVVDERGVAVTQRDLPRMALIQPTLKHIDMVLRAPGMLALHVALDTVEAATQATVWNDTVKAYDMGDLAAQWFSDFLGRKLRTVRFDPEQRRLADARWTGPIEAETAFADAYPLLVASTAGLDELNRRLAASGQSPVTMQRFRANLVLDGLDANGEDHLDEIVFAAPEGPVRIKLVKPCDRCTVPDVDPATGTPGHAVGDALSAYRADARLDGAITFGMNAVILEGIEATLKTGMTGRATYKFA